MRNIAIVLALAAASPAFATIVSFNGGASVGTSLNGAITGTGTAADPFLISVTMTGATPRAVLNIDDRTGDPANTVHDWSAHFRVLVLNNTGGTWTFMNNDVQSVLGVDSSEGDGLSFAQGVITPPVRPFTCDLLPVVLETVDVRDWVNFRGGSVLNGQTMTMNYVLSDNGPRDRQDYLVLTPNVIPAPAFGGLLAMGGLIAGRRRRA